MSALLLTACGSKGKWTADNFAVTPTPMEYLAGDVPVTISANIPAKSMNKKAIVTCIPVLRWDGGEIASEGATLQGEMVEANHQIVSYKNGGHATLRASFPFKEGMEKSDLYMTFNARKGNKKIAMPEVKIGYGVVCTAALVNRTAKTVNYGLAPDNFQRLISQKQTATVKFLIGQANLRGSELNSQNVQDFIKTLRNIKSDSESLVLNNVEISAYASPDGALNVNEKLAERREQVSEDFVNQQLKNNKLSTNIDAKFTAEDWEGFQELVSQSNLQDKDLILRVLSMYTDPEQREQEIKNIATVYSELANAVLPELRRARMIINYDVIGRNDEQIMSLLASAPDQLSIEEMLYAANILAEKDAQKEAVYQQIIKRFPNDYRAYNNLGNIMMRQGKADDAQKYYRQALSINSSAPEPNVNLGLLALQNGDVHTAETYFGKGAGSDNIDEALGNLYIAQGKYNQAAVKLEKSCTNSAALAQILAQDYAAAQQTFDNMKQTDATTDYLKAIHAARMGKHDLMKSYIESASAKDAYYAARAKVDTEFMKR